jgi:hypothetical protein
MVGDALRLPGWVVGCRLRLLPVDGPEPLDGDIQIAHGAKVGVHPFQFAPYSLPFGVGNHRREKRQGCTQAGKFNAHLVLGRGIVLACRFVICGQVHQKATHYNSKGGVARHHCIQSQMWLRPCGAADGLACWFRRRRHGCFARPDVGRHRWRNRMADRIPHMAGGRRAIDLNQMPGGWINYGLERPAVALVSINQTRIRDRSWRSKASTCRSRISCCPGCTNLCGVARQKPP